LTLGGGKLITGKGRNKRAGREPPRNLGGGRRGKTDAVRLGAGNKQGRKRGKVGPSVKLKGNQQRPKRRYIQQKDSRKQTENQ